MKLVLQVLLKMMKQSSILATHLQKKTSFTKKWSFLSLIQGKFHLHLR